jgi:hypothetical protein
MLRLLIIHHFNRAVDSDELSLPLPPQSALYRRPASAQKVVKHV